MLFSSLFYLILIPATSIFCCLPFSVKGNNETDRLALLRIKAAITHDPLGVMSSWNESLHFCKWQGVTCGHRHLRVRALDLNSSRLTEYGMGNEPSTFGDVYSFGILLLEMLTGKRPTDNMFKEGLNLHDFVKAAMPDHVMEILDEGLVKDIVGEDTDTRDHAPLWSKSGYAMVILEALTALLGIALSCSAELPQERLDMSDVAAKLSSIRNKLLGTHLRRHRRNLRGV